MLRHPDGRVSSAPFQWSEQLPADLAQLASTQPDRNAVQRFGDPLRAFLERLGWQRHEARLEEALAAGQPVHLTFRFAAAELCALPWECVTLQASGIPLGQLPGCLI